MAHHAQKLLLAPISRFAIGNVEDHPQPATALLIKQRCRHQDLHATAVLAQGFPLQVRQGSCRESGRHDLLQCLVSIWRYQLAPIEGLSEHLGSAVAKYVREAVIDCVDAPAESAPDLAENVGPLQRARLRLAVLELLLETATPGDTDTRANIAGKCPVRSIER